MEGPSYGYPIPSTASDAFVSHIMCDVLNANISGLTAYPASGNTNTYTIPSCLLVASSTLRRLTLTGFKIPDLSQLPQEIEELFLSQCSFTGPSSTPSSPAPNSPNAPSSLGPPSSGIIVNSNKEIDWSTLFDHFPNITSLSLDTCSIRGGLPSVLPARISNFVMTSNTEMTGGVPSTFFDDFWKGTASTFLINLANSNIGGSFPSFNMPAARTLDSLSIVYYGAGFIGNLPETPFDLVNVRYTFTLNFAMNSLSGAFPANFFKGIGQPYNFNVVLTSSGLGGKIPETLFSPLSQLNNASPDSPQSLPEAIAGLSSNYSASSSFSFSASQNKFNGSLPNGLFAGIPAAKYFYASFELNSDLTGPWPADLFSNLAPGPSNSTDPFNATTFYFNINYCKLNGTLPPSPFTTVGGASSFTFVAISNNFIGDIPTNFFKGVNPKPSTYSGGSCSFSLIDHRLTGTIPTNLFPSLEVSNKLSIFNINFQRTVKTLFTGLTGTLPANAFSKVNASDFVAINFLGNRLSGVLPPDILPFLRGSTIPQVGIFLSTNNFSGIIPNAWAELPLSTLGLSSNALTGTLPSAFFSYLPIRLTNLDVSLNPLLGGTLPALTSTGINLVLYLHNTSIDVCSVTTSNPDFALPSRLSYCNVNATNVCSVSEHCAEVYAKCGPNCGAIVGSCPISTRPSPDFICQGSIWTAPDSVTIPTLVITSSGTSTTIVINGNLTTSSVVYRGIGTKLIVTGCTANLSQIRIELTPSEVEKLKSSPSAIPLLSSAANCTEVDFSTLSITAKVDDSSCKRVTAKNLVSEDGSLLSAVFSINTSKCNTWWIVLVSVLCGAVALAVIIFIILVLTVPSIRSAVRPYSKASRNRSKNAAEMN